MRYGIFLPGLAAVLMTAAGCSSRSADSPATSGDEAAQLNDAAAMLDANGFDVNRADTATNESARQ